jgi:hypothetical protein
MVELSKVALASTVALLGWAYKATRPPAPAILGAPGGPPVTSPRVRLKDGRHLAYMEAGVHKENARYKVIFIHGFASTKETGFPVSQVLTKSCSIVNLNRASCRGVRNRELIESSLANLQPRSITWFVCCDRRSLWRSWGHTRCSSTEPGTATATPTRRGASRATPRTSRSSPTRCSSGTSSTSSAAPWADTLRGAASTTFLTGHPEARII